MKDSVLQRVRELAKFYNLSDNALAKKMGIPQATLSGWYNLGRTPSMDMILTLLSVFPNLSAEWLLRGEGGMFKGENVSTTNGNGNNVVNGNGNSNISQSQGSGIGMSLYGKLVKAIMRGCPTQEEQDKILEELDKYAQE